MSDPLTESAKATQEVAKASSKALEVVGGLGGWLDRIFGEGIEHSVKSIWTNKIRERSIASSIHSWERLELLLHKTEERLRKKGVKELRLVPPKFALPLLQNATMEDVDDLHSLWSALLATAMNANGEQVLRKFVTILSDLTAADAAVLRAIWSEWQSLDKTDEAWRATPTLAYGPGVRGTEAHDEVSIITLNRLGLIAPSYTQIKTTYVRHDGFRAGTTAEEGDEVQVYGDLLTVVVTPLGEAFCRAVME